jgi:hypothetical protein
MYNVIIALSIVIGTFLLFILFVYFYNRKYDEIGEIKNNKSDEDKLNWIDRYFLIQKLIIQKEYTKLADLCDENVLNQIKSLKKINILLFVTDQRVTREDNKYVFTVNGRDIYNNLQDRWIFDKKEGKILLVGIS